MEASVRVLCNSSTRHFPNSLCLLPKKLVKPSPNSPPFHYYPYRPVLLPPLSLNSPQNHHPVYSSNARIPTPSIPLGFPRSFSSPQFLLASLFSSSNFARIFSGPKGKSFEWNYAPNRNKGREVGIVCEKGPVVTAVLLGWLGSKPKHLRRYVELYNSRGIHAVTFSASVRDVLSFDLGRKLQERIYELARELTSWLSESEKDGRERLLIFHTFSNTGWLAYGAILDHLQDRPDLLEKIKGCVVDSGGDANIDPKVWAAGFTAALLKKNSSSAYPSVESGERNELENGVDTSKIQEKEPLLIETLLLSAFEKLFSYLLNLPNVNQRLTKIICILLKNQPPSPQLYLYSTADKVIPFLSVESLIENQRRAGKNIWSFNFASSPHVDHYRTYPNVYSSQLEKFLNHCFIMVKK